MEIIFEECPSCKTHACAFAVIDGVTRCPMCAPTPDKTPHDYRPGLFTLEQVQTQHKEWAKALATPNLISGVCCGDAGDCGHECGIG